MYTNFAWLFPTVFDFVKKILLKWSDRFRVTECRPKTVQYGVGILTNIWPVFYFFFGLSIQVWIYQVYWESVYSLAEKAISSSSIQSSTETSNIEFGRPQNVFIFVVSSIHVTIVLERELWIPPVSRVPVHELSLLYGNIIGIEENWKSQRFFNTDEKCSLQLAFIHDITKKKQVRIFCYPLKLNSWSLPVDIFFSSSAKV